MSTVEENQSITGRRSPAERALISALNNLKRGKADEYHEVLEYLSSTAMDVLQVQKWLMALSSCVSELSKTHDQLIAASLNLMWYEDEATANCYVDYLTSLLSTQTCYLRSVLSSLTRHFWSQPIVTGKGATDDQVLRHIHKAVQAVMALVPTASSVLMPLLSKGFPFKAKNVAIQELALRNILYVTRYCPTLSDSIYELAIHQMLAIDVELPNFEEDGDGIKSEEEEEEEEEEPQFSIELDDKERHVSVASHPTGLGAQLSKAPIMKSEQPEKLDVMMTVCVQHFHCTCHHKDGSVRYEAGSTLLNSLIKIFENVLLPTHASSCVQFLLFILTSWHQDFPGFFLDFLWDKFQDPNTPAVLRQSAAAYIASYIARSKCVSLKTTKVCLSVVTKWIHGYLDFVSPENMKPDVHQHGPFFSLCQALFYMFVFRHKELLDSHGGSEFLRRLNFERIITSRLNPLKVCLPSVVQVFASLSSQHEVAFCFSILEQNKRILFGCNAGKPTYLDCFFPFDPYRLKRSGSFVRSLYHEWDEVKDSTQEIMNCDDEVDSLASSLEHSLPSQFS